MQRYTFFAEQSNTFLVFYRQIKSNEELNDIKQLIADYYAKRLDDMTERMWQSGELDQKCLDEINGMDLHAWLREQKAKENVK